MQQEKSAALIFMLRGCVAKLAALLHAIPARRVGKMNLLYSINASFTVVRIFKLCYDDRIRREKQNKRRGDRMDLLIKIGILQSLHWF